MIWPGWPQSGEEVKGGTGEGVGGVAGGEEMDGEWYANLSTLSPADGTVESCT